MSPLYVSVRSRALLSMQVKEREVRGEVEVTRREELVLPAREVPQRLLELLELGQPRLGEHPVHQEGVLPTSHAQQVAHLRALDLVERPARRFFARFVAEHDLVVKK